MTPDLPKITCAMPLGEDPADDPDEETMLWIAKEHADQIAAERGLHAVDVKLVEIRPGLYGDDGHYARDESGYALAPRLALFTARAMRI